MLQVWLERGTGSVQNYFTKKKLWRKHCQSKVSMFIVKRENVIQCSASSYREAHSAQVWHDTDQVAPVTNTDAQSFNLVAFCEELNYGNKDDDQHETRVCTTSSCVWLSGRTSFADNRETAVRLEYVQNRGMPMITQYSMTLGTREHCISNITSLGC